MNFAEMSFLFAMQTNDHPSFLFAIKLEEQKDCVWGEWYIKEVDNSENMNAGIISYPYLLRNPYIPCITSGSHDRVTNNIGRWMNNILQKWSPI